MEEEQRSKLIKECERIEEDADFGRRKWWNDRDAISSRYRKYLFLERCLYAGTAVLASGEFLKISGLVETLPVLRGATAGLFILSAVAKEVISAAKYENMVKERHDLAGKYDTLLCEARFYREHRIPTTNIQEVTSEVKELLIAKTRINQELITPWDENSYPKAKKSIESGQSMYKADKKD